MNTFCVLRPGIHPWAALHVELAGAKTPTARELLQRQIDWLVYELYGLTEEEIAIVEEGV